MGKISKGDLEVPIDDRVLVDPQAEGLGAEFEQRDLLKRLVFRRKIAAGESTTEILTIDQNAFIGQYQRSWVREASGPEGKQLFELSVAAIQGQLNYHHNCDFCGAEQSDTNKVVAGETHRICGDCVAKFRKSLDAQSNN